MAEGSGPPACPVQTASAWSHQELACGGAVSEIRAYKLGKKRWSYNQVELLLREAGGDRVLGLHQAINVDDVVPESLQESGVGFQLLLANGRKAQLHVYLVHEASHPPASHLSARPASARKAAKAAQGAASGSGGAGSGGGSDGGASPPAPLHSWHLVSRSDCCKGCSGPVLRAIRRFGPPSRRKGGAPPPADSSLGKKDPRYLYLSMDEACTHVGATAFRLLAALYEEGGTRFMGAGVSPPIRVLANNDVPTGAAHLQLSVMMDSRWEGWASVEPAAAGLAAVADAAGVDGDGLWGAADGGDATAPLRREGISARARAKRRRIEAAAAEGVAAEAVAGAEGEEEQGLGSGEPERRSGRGSRNPALRRRFAEALAELARPASYVHVEDEEEQGAAEGEEEEEEERQQRRQQRQQQQRQERKRAALKAPAQHQQQGEPQHAQQAEQQVQQVQQVVQQLQQQVEALLARHQQRRQAAPHAAAADAEAAHGAADYAALQQQQQQQAGQLPYLHLAQQQAAVQLASLHPPSLAGMSQAGQAPQLLPAYAAGAAGQQAPGWGLTLENLLSLLPKGAQQPAVHRPMPRRIPLEPLALKQMASTNGLLPPQPSQQQQQQEHPQQTFPAGEQAGWGGATLESILSLPRQGQL